MDRATAKPLLALLPLLASITGACTREVRAHYPDGIVRLEGRESRVSGARTGVWSYWYADGTLREEGAYTADHREGTWTQWHPNGQVASRGERRFDPRTSSSPRVGPWTFWHETGSRKASGTFDAAGRREGTWSFWDPDGAPDEERSGEYREDQRVR